jgi:tRNA modification GTPase
LFDTAGLRAADNPIEAEGVARAAQAIDEAQLVITVIDGSRELDRDDRAAITQTNGRARILLLNKLDLGTAALPALQREFPEVVADRQSGRFIAGSVRRPETIDEVRKAIAAIGWGGAAGGSRALVANLRQIDCLTRAQQALAHALATIESAYPVDLLSADMREAIAAYGEVTGETVTEEVLSGIFSRFCVGK